MKKERTGKKLKPWQRKIAIGMASAIMLFFIIDKISPVNTNLVFAPVIEARDGTVLHAYMAKDAHGG